MAVPSLPGNVLRADKTRYLLQMRGLRHRLLRERLPVDAARDLVNRDDVSYFFVDIARLDRLKAIPVYPVHKAMTTAIKDPSCCSAGDLRALIEGRSFNLFDLVRLNECLANRELAGTIADAELGAFHLRDGLPQRSVVASLRVFDPLPFDAMQDRICSIKELAQKVAPLVGRTAAQVESSLDLLRVGYDIGKGGRRGKWRITTRYATAIRNSLADLANGRVSVPALDDLFGYRLREFPLGSKRGTRPLGRVDGAVF